jgi:hypothetical protein
LEATIGHLVTTEGSRPTHPVHTTTTTIEVPTAVELMLLVRKVRLVLLPRRLLLWVVEVWRVGQVVVLLLLEIGVVRVRLVHARQGLGVLLHRRWLLLLL